jgi:CheY-like chemotaxis protein
MGSFGNAERSEIAATAQESAFTVHFESEPHDAVRWLEQAEAQAILLDGESATSERFAIDRRAESRSATIPMLFLVETATDLRFAGALAGGADDVVERRNWDYLRSRLRHLPKEPMALAECTRGSALVGESDHARRVLSGRVLRNAGYSVSFAVEGEDLFRNVRAGALSVVVANPSLASTRDLVLAAREVGNEALFIFTCPPREIRKYCESLADLSGVTITDAFAPAENVLFVANELGRPRGVDQRASPRILYGTAVAFRGVGRNVDDYGYTYNVSENGMYVRTLAPPDENLVWIELTPPRCDRRVRLVGRVAWRRGLAQGQFATVPPGFGMQIVDGAQMDLDAWREGYRAFAQDVQ